MHPWTTNKPTLTRRDVCGFSFESAGACASNSAPHFGEVSSLVTIANGSFKTETGLYIPRPASSLRGARFVLRAPMFAVRLA